MTKMIDLDKLDPKERARVQRALHPRDKVLSLKFSEDELTLWRACAKAAGKTMTRFIADACNAAARPENLLPVKRR